VASEQVCRTDNRNPRRGKDCVRPGRVTWAGPVVSRQEGQRACSPPGIVRRLG